MLITFYCFTNPVYYIQLEIYNKTIIEYSLWFSPLEMYSKTIIGFGFCDMPNYQCLGKSYISLAFGSADNSYFDIDNSVYHKNLIQ